MTPESTDTEPKSASAAVRVAWGVLGLFLLVWTVFEAVKHTGLTIPLAVAGLLVPLLARLAPGTAAVQNLVLRVWIPLAIMLVCSAIPGPAEDTAAPFTFGMAWLTHLALRRALGHGIPTA
ncbi:MULTISPECIES: hypothetical protein [unclassified Streptomyces]|uniref:hypothetical protein n=1 Tax=unclassified Streptomyces TaxID=2593676 RepID=UPI00224DFEBC|nr:MULTISPECIES: hypothetical protein [unclassified Streptomyces]MCX5141916.1 hypothetical protein [Streptomyces sp. NBC_00338]WRZ66390.1 hypothetical protein OG408_22060 [Streptomyces sp. NBC_01257]